MIVGGANINTSYIAHQGGTNYGPGINIHLPLGGSEGAADVVSLQHRGAGRVGVRGPDVAADVVPL